MSDQEILDLRRRVAELEKIVDRELGYSLRNVPDLNPQVVDCGECGSSFEITLENGLRCPDCGATPGGTTA